MAHSLDRARADVGAGRLWKARDRLNGLLLDRHDDELLDLLATVHFDMGDRPAAGALWFVTGRTDDKAVLAIEAWRERHGGDQARWRSLPNPVRRGPLPKHLDELRRAARRDSRRPAPVGHATASVSPRPGRWSAVVGSLVLWSITLGLLGLLGVGFWTVARWIFG